MTDTDTAPGVLSDFVERSRNLYSLPAVAMKVVELTGHPKVDVRALKECIENDPALTAKLLRVVNSSLFGLSREVTDLNQALALLGVKPLKLLVLGFSLPANLFNGLEAQVLERYWRHTLTKAVAAREIAESCWQTNGDEAFIAGLLQPIGMLALIQDLGDSYVTFLDRVFHEGGDLKQLEIEAFGFDHAILSARLLDHWGLPESLVRAVGEPHVVDRLLSLDDDRQPLPQILHLADLCSLMLAQQNPATLNELLDAGQRYRELTVEQVEALVAGLQERVPGLADVLALPLGDEVDYSVVLAEALAQMAQTAEEAIVEESCRQSSHLLDEARRLGNLARQVAQGAKQPAHAVECETSIPEFEMTPGLPTLPVDLPDPRNETTDLEVLGRVSAAVASCRQHRCPLSLAFFAVDRYDEALMTRGVDGAQQLLWLVETAIATGWDRPVDYLTQGDGRFAVIIADCERQPAVALARRLVRGINQWSHAHGAAPTSTVSLSAGLATLALPPKNFPPQDLIDAAQRCLYAAQVSGGDVVKSIDIY